MNKFKEKNKKSCNLVYLQFLSQNFQKFSNFSSYLILRNHSDYNINWLTVPEEHKCRYSGYAIPVGNLEILGNVKSCENDL